MVGAKDVAGAVDEEEMIAFFHAATGSARALACPLETRRLCQEAEGLILANFCHSTYPGHMSTMNISLPDSLKSFVDKQVSERGYGTSSEYVRELIRRDRDREQLRGLLMEGASSPPTEQVGGDYFDSLRNRVQSRTKT